MGHVSIFFLIVIYFIFFLFFFLILIGSPESRVQGPVQILYYAIYLGDKKKEFIGKSHNGATMQLLVGFDLSRIRSRNVSLQRLRQLRMSVTMTNFLATCVTKFSSV